MFTAQFGSHSPRSAKQTNKHDVKATEIVRFHLEVYRLQKCHTVNTTGTAQPQANHTSYWAWRQRFYRDKIKDGGQINLINSLGLQNNLRFLREMAMNHRKKQRECPNPLFLKWLEEWRDEAKEKNSKLQYTYGKVRE